MRSWRQVVDAPWLIISLVLFALVVSVMADDDASKAPEGWPPFDPQAHAQAAGSGLSKEEAPEVPAFAEQRRILLPYPGWAAVVGESTAWSWFSWGPRAPRLIAVDAATLETRGTTTYMREGEPLWYPGSGAFVHPDGGAPLLVLADTYNTTVRVFDVSDPAHPAIHLDYRGFPHGNWLTEVGDGRTVLLQQWGLARILDPASGQGYAFPPAEQRSVALAGPRDHRLVLFHCERQGAWELELWDIADPAHATRRFHRASPLESYAPFLLAGDGSIAVYVTGAGSGEAPVAHLLDLAGGAELGQVEGSDPGQKVMLSDTPEGRYLLFVSGEQIDSWDLADPSAPALSARRNVALCGDVSRQCNLARAVSSTDPLLFVGDRKAQGVLALDARSLADISRWNTDQGQPYELEPVERGDRSRRLVVSLSRIQGSGKVLAVPGRFAQASIEWSDPAAPREEGLRVRVEPEQALDNMVTVGGRWLAIWDKKENVLTLVDTATGEVTDWSGLHDSFSGTSRVSLAAAGGRVALVNFVSHRCEIFDVVAGKFVWVGAFPFGPDPESGIRGVGVRKDGLVAALFAEGVQLVLPDGSAGGSLPLEGFWYEAAFAPQGDRLLVWADLAWLSGRMAMIDVSDPRAPRVLWTRDGVAGYAMFAREGEAVIAALPSWYLIVGLFDTETGEPLGEPSEPISKWFYSGAGTTFGRGEEARATYWKWTWSGWTTALYDLSGARPSLIVESPEYWRTPRILRRSDQQAAYELHEEWGGDRRGPVWLYHPEETIDELGVLPARKMLRELRWGFLAGGLSTEPTGFAVWRDPAMNRAPDARAGSDQALECSGPAGTPATLDGRASTDPDSAPGTEDDLLAWRWEEMGSRLGDQPRIESDFTVGVHEVTLEVEDRLGAVGTDGVRITVEDTLPPEVTLTVDPSSTGQPPIFSGEWVATGKGTDRCDGEVDVALLLQEDLAVLEAPWTFEAAESEEILVRRDAVGGYAVILRGPNEARLAEHWAQARRRGGLEVRNGFPVRYYGGRHVPLPPEPSIVARYAIAPGGELLAAIRYAAEADFVVEARAQDAAGHEAGGQVSLRQRIAEICGELPPGMRCEL